MEAEKTNAFVKQFIDLKIKNTTNIHIELKNTFLRMQGTGFFIINAPSTMQKDVVPSLDILLHILKDSDHFAKINYNVF